VIKESETDRYEIIKEKEVPKKRKKIP